MGVPSLRGLDPTVLHHLHPVRNLRIDQRAEFGWCAPCRLCADFGRCFANRRLGERLVDGRIEPRNGVLWRSLSYREADPVFHDERRKARFDNGRDITEHFYAPWGG